MTVYKTTTPDEALAAASRCLDGQEGLIVYSGQKGIFVMTGQYPSYDAGFCHAFNIRVGKTIYFGGSIVSFAGDLELCEIHFGPSDFGPNAINHICQWLVDMGICANIDGNDLMVDEKKVGSFAMASTITGWYESVAHFSINTNLHLIQRICTKPMEKTPGALSEYSINADMIWNELLRAGIVPETDDNMKGDHEYGDFPNEDS